MKILSLILAIFLCGMATPLFAQVTDKAAEKIELTRWAIEIEKKELVARNMELSEPENQSFWSLYNDYQVALKRVDDRTFKLITDYAEHWKDLSDEKAQALLDEFLRIETQKLKLKKSYVKRFRRILPAKKVARYFQLENKWDAAIKAELAHNIPLIR